MGCGGSTNMNGDSAPTPFSIKGLSVGNPLSNSDSNNKLNPSATTPGCHQDYCQEKNGGGGSVEHRDGGAVLSPDVSHPTSGAVDDKADVPPSAGHHHDGQQADENVNIVNVNEIHPHSYREDAAGHMPLANTHHHHHHHHHQHHTPPFHNGMMTFKSILTEKEREAAADHHELPPKNDESANSSGGYSRVSNNNSHYVFDGVAPFGCLGCGDGAGSFVPLGSTPLIDAKKINGTTPITTRCSTSPFHSNKTDGSGDDVSPITSFPNVCGSASPHGHLDAVPSNTTTRTSTVITLTSDALLPVLQTTELPRQKSFTVAPPPSHDHDNNTVIPPGRIAGCVELLSATETSMTSSGSTLLSSAAPISSLPPNQST